MFEQLKKIFGSEIRCGVHTAHEFITINTDKGVLEIMRGDTIEEGEHEISLINKPVTTGAQASDPKSNDLGTTNEQPESSEFIEQQIELLRELDARWGMDGSHPRLENCIEVLKKGFVE